MPRFASPQKKAGSGAGQSVGIESKVNPEDGWEPRGNGAGRVGCELTEVEKGWGG